MKNLQARARVLVVLTMAAVCASAAPASAAPAPGTAARPDSSGAAARATAASKDALLVIDGTPGTHVTIDGLRMGNLPLGGPLVLEPGTHYVEGELRGYAPYQAEMAFDSKGERRRLQMRLIPLRRRDAVLYSVVLAGLGENYVGRPVLGYVLTAAELGGLLAGAAGQMAFDNNRRDYLVLYDAYLNSVSDADVSAARDRATKAWDRMRSAESLRNTGLIVAAGAIVAGVLDVWLRFPSVEIGPGRPTPPLETRRVLPADPTAVHVACNLRF